LEPQGRSGSCIFSLQLSPGSCPSQSTLIAWRETFLSLSLRWNSSLVGQIWKGGEWELRVERKKKALVHWSFIYTPIPSAVSISPWLALISLVACLNSCKGLGAFSPGSQGKTFLSKREKVSLRDPL
jgi:hypothetical protein